MRTWPFGLYCHLIRLTLFSFSDVAEEASATVLETSGFRQKEPQIGRSSDNRRFCSPNYSAWRRSRTESLLSNARLLLFVLPLAPASLARSAHLAPLTSLRPRWGLALFEWLRLQQKSFEIVKPNGAFTAMAKLCKDRATAL